jgi:LPS O-antigen subunit length determinant protein (WzzB/FepE family)
MMNIENEAPQVQMNSDDEVSLKDLILKVGEIWKYLLSKWKIIVIIGISSAALGLVYSIFKTPEYNATLSFSVIEKSSQGGLSALAGQFGLGSSSDGVFSGNNMIELLQSRNLIERTLLSEVEINGRRCRLIEYYRELNPPEEDDAISQTISYPLDVDRELFTREQDSLLYNLNKTITTDKLSIDKKAKDINIINVSFLNEDELFAKLFTEKLIAIVSEFYIQTKTKNITTNLDKMEIRADSARQEYEKALAEQAKFEDENQNPSKRLLMVERQKIQTRVQLTGTTYVELVKNIEILKLDLIQQTPLIQVIDAPIMPLEIERLGKLKGIILGGFIGGFLIVGWLLAVYYYRRIMQEE